MTLALELEGITRRFGKVVANDVASIAVEAGTIHAVVGENGAGKSTLLKIAYGQLRADEGKITIKGKEIDRLRHSPHQAMDLGVGMVHQHFMLVPTLTVVENVVLGRELVRGPFLDLEQARRSLLELSERFGMSVEPERLAGDLSVGEQQRVEILKVLWQGCDVLILDEPTAVLTPGEVEQLFEALRGLVAQGMTVVLITHKLDEVVAIADRITVMRKGAVADILDGKIATVQDLARAMVGRPVLLQIDKTPARVGEIILDVADLCALRDNGTEALRGVALGVRAGEIVGVAGVAGNGQTELQECLVGLRRPTAGRMRLAGLDLAPLAVADRYRAGLAHVPEDRHDRAVVLDFSLEDNVALGRQCELSRKGVLDREARRREALRCIRDFDVRPAEPSMPLAHFSGGNQQKIVLGREIGRPHNRLLVCAQPTRGVDIGAIESIHKQILAARDAGLAVLLFSADLTELLSLSDRLLVLHRGQVSLVLDADELLQEGARDRVGLAMTAGQKEQNA